MTLHLNRTQHGRRGVALLLVTFLILLLLAVIGCATDLFRVLVRSSTISGEVQSAVLAAVLEVDGTEAGLERARQAAARPEFASVQVEFAEKADGPYEAAPARAEGSRFVRVTATAPVPLMVVPAIMGEKASRVWASATAQQQGRENFLAGLFPYSPLAHAEEDPRFGFEPGEMYTLRWALHPSLEAGNVCSGDRAYVDQVQAENFAPSGFIESGSAASMRQSILTDYQTAARSIGDRLRMTGGTKFLEHQYLEERYMQDSDPDASTYAQYAADGRGNGRRLVAVPVHSAYPDMKFLGVAAFFLQRPEPADMAADRPVCAEYVGAYMLGSRWKGAGDSGYFVSAFAK